MNIEAEKIELAKMLLDTENVEIIQSIRQIFKGERSSDFWNELTPLEQEEIRNGIDSLEKGERIPYQEVLKKIRE